MKCIDCKFCAFINESNEQLTVRISGIESTLYPMIGAYCTKVAAVIMNVEECTGYEKSKHKKVKVQ